MARSRGRKPGKREPNGRLSRRKADRAEFVKAEERDAMSVALEARERVLGVKPHHARHQMAGTAVGRLCLSEQISKDQYDAADYFLRDREAARRAILAPMEYREPRPDGMEGWSDGTTSYEEFVERANARWAHIKRLVKDVDVEVGTSLPSKALDLIVCRDIEAPYLVGSLKLALNALVRFYLEGKRQAA